MEWWDFFYFTLENLVSPNKQNALFLVLALQEVFGMWTGLAGW